MLGERGIGYNKPLNLYRFKEKQHLLNNIAVKAKVGK